LKNDELKTAKYLKIVITTIPIRIVPRDDELRLDGI